MALQIIGAGFGRTGTASLQEALQSLGFNPCYHMREVFARPADALVWDRAAQGEKVDFAALFDGWRATVDWPACTFYRELIDLFPSAKVLLSVRDPDRWYESCLNTIFPTTISALASRPDPSLPSGPAAIPGPSDETRRMINRLIWKRTFNDRFEDRSYAIEVFNRHNADVKRTVPPERLLVFDVAQGWGPLCDFLGVPQPGDRPFPRLNDTASFLERRQFPPIPNST